jgi:competence protein ComEA
MTWADRFKISDALALAGVLGALAVAAVVIARANRPPELVRVTAAEPDPVVQVHITGEVIWPGLYELKAGSRTQDAITAAHGPTYEADLARVNLAATLRDGDRIIVPRIVVPVPQGAAAPAPHRATRGAAPSAGEAAQTVNVNTATAADLERLPGVGPVLAGRIVEHREANGLFRQLDGLLQVKGIGPRLYARLKPHLTLD